MLLKKNNSFLRHECLLAIIKFAQFFVETENYNACICIGNSIMSHDEGFSFGKFCKTRSKRSIEVYSVEIYPPSVWRRQRNEFINFCHGLWWPLETSDIIIQTVTEKLHRLVDQDRRFPESAVLSCFTFSSHIGTVLTGFQHVKMFIKKNWYINSEACERITRPDIFKCTQDRSS
jgi:hypothetical protein